VNQVPVPAAAALELAAQARRLLVKVGRETRRFETDGQAISAEEARAWLVHPDGLLRVPVLVLGDLLVRGFTEELYREALEVERGVRE
jgi:arsenate reductase-like glutaredoxin family protein